MGGIEAVDSVVKSNGNEANADGVTSSPQQGEGTSKSAGWSGAWDDLCEMCGFRKGNGNVISAVLLKEMSQ